MSGSGSNRERAVELALELYHPGSIDADSLLAEARKIEHYITYRRTEKEEDAFEKAKNEIRDVQRKLDHDNAAALRHKT